MRGSADQGYDKQIKQMRVIKTAGSTNGMTNSGNYGGKCTQLQQMRYTHFAGLRCCSNLNGLLLWCNLYYIKLAVESLVSFCYNSLEVFIRLVLSKANHLQLDSCLSKCSKVFYAIILGRHLERNLNTVIWHYDAIILSKQVILEMMFCVYLFS